MSSESSVENNVEATAPAVDENVEQQQSSVSLQDATPLQSIDVIYKMLNKAAGAGVYTIDESHALKILVTKVANALAIAAAASESA